MNKEGKWENVGSKKGCRRRTKCKKGEKGLGGTSKNHRKATRQHTRESHPREKGKRVRSEMAVRSGVIKGKGRGANFTGKRSRIKRGENDTHEVWGIKPEVKRNARGKRREDGR